MSIVASDIQYRYSGGAANTDPNACLGGAISTAGAGTLDDAVLNDLFDNVSAAEATAGDVEYRGVYVKNNHGTLAYQDARLYFTTAAAQLDIAVAAEAAGSTMATIANESAAPVGVTFSHPTTYAAGLQLNGSGGLTAGQARGVWVRRTVAASAPAETAHTETLRCEGYTA